MMNVGAIKNKRRLLFKLKKKVISCVYSIKYIIKLAFSENLNSFKQRKGLMEIMDF